MTMTRGHRSVLVGAAALLLLTACGDDDDSSATATTAEPAEEATTTTAAPDGGVPAELAEYCLAATEINRGDFPTVEQLNEYQDLAPDDIQDEVAVALPAFVEAIESGNPESAFADPAVGEAVEAITDFEIETCGPEVAGDDADEEATGEVDPEFAEWCAALETIGDAPFPDEAMLAAIETDVPEELSDDVPVVTAAFREGIAAGDPGLGFVRESYEHIVVINTFADEHCGIPQDPSDFQDPALTTADPAAAQVAVAATEFGFAFEPPTAAGPTTFTMTNDGELAHVMVILQAAEGVSAEEAFGSEDDDKVAAFVGSYVAVPGAQEVITMDLAPANYMMFCYLPLADGTPHLAHGMTQAFTVT